MNFFKHIGLLQQRQKGGLSAEEQKTLDQLHTSDVGRATERIWEASAGYRSDYRPDTDAALQRFRQRMAAQRATPIPVRALRPRRSVWAVAAAIALVAVVAVTLLWQNGLGAPDMQTVTAETMRQTVQLADGTRVTLNKGATLVYPTQLSGQPERTVELSGEAYFEVTSDPEHPFVIDTDGARVEVLGTAFNLRAMPSEAFTEVEVKEGKVALREIASGESIVLQAKQCGRYSTQTGFSTEAAPHLNRLAWHTNELNFVDTPLRQVIPMLERFYEIEITALNGLTDANCPITSNLQQDDLSSIPAVIEVLTPLEMVEIQPGIYELRGEGC